MAHQRDPVTEFASFAEQYFTTLEEKRDARRREELLALAEELMALKDGVTVLLRNRYPNLGMADWVEAFVETITSTQSRKSLSGFRLLPLVLIPELARGSRGRPRDDRLKKLVLKLAQKETGRGRYSRIVERLQAEHGIEVSLITVKKYVLETDKKISRI